MFKRLIEVLETLLSIVNCEILVLGWPNFGWWVGVIFEFRILSVGGILVHIFVCCCCVVLWLMWNFFRGLVCVRGRAPCGVLVLVESKTKVEVMVLIIQSVYNM